MPVNDLDGLFVACKLTDAGKTRVKNKIDKILTMSLIVPMSHDTKLEYVAGRTANSPTHWTEPSTCRGVLRSLKEAAAKCEPSKPLVDAMERATIALLDYDKALGKTEQGRWYEGYLLSGARNTLVHEVYNASLAGVPFSAVSGPCQLALDATQAALEAIEKASVST